VGLWQCEQCGSAIVLKMRWAKNKKLWIGMSVSFLVLSIFHFSVLPQWFTFHCCYVVVPLTLGGNLLITLLKAYFNYTISSIQTLKIVYISRWDVLAFSPKVKTK
jgi:hypothetical protein